MTAPNASSFSTTWPTSSLRSVVFAPDGRHVALTTAENAVLLLDLMEAGEKPVVLRRPGQLAILSPLSFSPDGTLLVAGDGGGGVSVWQVQTRREERWKSAANSHAVAFSPDGRILAASDSRGMRGFVNLWDVRERRKVHELDSRYGSIQSVAFAPNGKGLVVVGGGEPTACWWDLSVEPPVQRTATRGHRADVTALTFSPDARWLVSAGADRTLRFWDLTGKAPVEARVLDEQALGIPMTAALAPDGQTLATSRDLVSAVEIQLRAFPSGQEQVRWRAGNNHISGLVFMPDGQQLLSTSFDRSLRLWDIQERKELRRFEGHETPLLCLALSPDGRHVLSGGGLQRVQPDGLPVVKDGKFEWSDGSPRLWEVASGRQVRRLDNPEGEVSGLAFSPDGRWAAAVSRTRLLIWDLKTPGNRPFRVVEAAPGMRAVAFSPDGRLLLSLAVQGSGTLTVWEAKTGRKLAGWSLGHAQALRLAVASDSRHVAVGMDTGVIYLLRLTDLEKRR